MDMLATINDIPAELADYLAKPDYYQSIHKNTFLFCQGDPIKNLYMIVSGKVLVGKTSSDGREITLKVSGANDLIGEFITDDLPAHYLIDGKVIESGKVAVFNQRRLLKRLAGDPTAMIAFLKHANLQYRKDQTKFRDLLLYGKKGALFSTLIRLSNSYGIQIPEGILIDIQMTNQELANFCCTSRESVNRMLNSLKRDNVIKIEDGKIIICELDYLKKEINCENCPAILCTIN